MKKVLLVRESAIIVQVSLIAVDREIKITKIFAQLCRMTLKERSG